MLMFVERRLFQAGYCLVRRFAIAAESTYAPEYQSDNENDAYVEKNKDFNGIRSDDVKSLRVAIIGLPNVGKSTLINRLINRHVCATSLRMHVTREKSEVVYCEDDTQLVFVDTPGLVSRHEFKKFSLEPSFREDAKKAMETADVVGVVQDVSNKYTRGILNDKVLELVKMCRVGVPSVLIMNKIDQIKKKRELLSLVKSLTSEQGWPNFSDVFMVSALTSDGVKDLRTYFLDSAKHRDWDYNAEVVTDQSMETVIKHTVRAKFLDSLPNEIPYKIKYEVEHLDTSEDGTVHCVIVAQCESARISKIVMGKGGRRVKNVALEAEQECSNAFRTTFRLRIAVCSSDEN